MEPTQQPIRRRLDIYWRFAITIAAIGTRLLIVGIPPANPLFGLIADVFLLALGFWVMAAGRREFGPAFGQRRAQWTDLFGAPLVAAAALIAIDLIAMGVIK